MFKERLKIMVANIGGFLLGTFLALLLISALTSLAIVGSKIAIVVTIVKCILFIILGLIALSSIITFVDWLFVEPYKEHKKSKK